MMKKYTHFYCKILVITLLAILLRGENDCFSANNLGVMAMMKVEEVNFDKFSIPTDTIKKEKKSKKVKDKPEDRTLQIGKKGKITFETFDKNYERAMKFYKNQQYLSAARLFEELYPLSLGTPMSDTILFAFADCYYQNQDYELAAFHYKDYARRYPNTTRSELAYFRCLQAIYNVSPYYSLDQFETKYAIEEINLFIQQYPYSKYMDECNSMLDELRNKLAKKEFEIVRLYFNTEKYEATQIATKNFMKDYPESQYIPEVLYILVQSNLRYAKKSVVIKKRERFLDCVAAFEVLTLNFPDSPFVELAKPYSEEAKKFLDKKNI